MEGNPEGGSKEDALLTISKEDRETLFKRADDGQSTPSDIFLILRGRSMRNSHISFSEIELIFRRLGISLTEHRFCEFLSAAKIIHSKKALGYTRIYNTFIEEEEFEGLFEYLELSVAAVSKETLRISPRNLTNFSMLALVVYSIAILISSNLMVYFYGGDIFGAIFCALIPLSKLL